jgi:hypothetical protein
LMAGEIASLLISRMAVPVLYFMAYHRKPKAAALSNASSEGLTSAQTKKDCDLHRQLLPAAGDSDC